MFQSSHKSDTETPIIHNSNKDPKIKHDTKYSIILHTNGTTKRSYCDKMPKSQNRGFISQVTNCKSLHDNSWLLPRR
jgi:hypothetical protein